MERIFAVNITNFSSRNKALLVSRFIDNERVHCEDAGFCLRNYYVEDLIGAGSQILRVQSDGSSDIYLNGDCFDIDVLPEYIENAFWQKVVSNYCKNLQIFWDEIGVQVRVREELSTTDSSNTEFIVLDGDFCVENSIEPNSLGTSQTYTMFCFDGIALGLNECEFRNDVSDHIVMRYLDKSSWNKSMEDEMRAYRGLDEEETLTFGDMMIRFGELIKDDESAVSWIDGKEKEMISFIEVIVSDAKAYFGDRYADKLKELLGIFNTIENPGEKASQEYIKIANKVRHLFYF